MKIRSQIILSQLPVAILIILISIFFISALVNIDDKAENILVENFKSILSMQRLNESLEELNNYIIYHPKSFDGETKKIESKIEQELLFQEKLISGKGEKEELTQSLRKKWESYQQSIHSLSQGDRIEKSYNDLKQTTASIIGLDQDALIRKKDDLSDLIIDYRFFISFFSFVSLIAGFFISWTFIGHFLKPFNKMIETVSQFGKTDKTVLLYIKGSDEIEKLSEEFNLMTNRIEEYHQSSLGRVIEDYENLKRAFDATPYPLLIFSDNNEVVIMNKSALRWLGVFHNRNKTKSPIFYVENSLRESLLKIVKQVQLTRKPYIPEKAAEPTTIYKKKKKILFMPYAYPIKEGSDTSRSISVLMVLRDLRPQSASELEMEQIDRAFVQAIQASLAEIQMAIHISLQEEVGPLTEKQKDILYAARAKSEELETLYQDFLTISKISKKNL